MNIYIAYWNNGMDYEDRRTIVIGVFSTHKLASVACKIYTDEINEDSNNRIWYKDQSTFITRVKLDKIIK